MRVVFGICCVDAVWVKTIIHRLLGRKGIDSYFYAAVFIGMDGIFLVVYAVVSYNYSQGYFRGSRLCFKVWYVYGTRRKHYYLIAIRCREAFAGDWDYIASI